MPVYVFMHADATYPDGYEEFKSRQPLPLPMMAWAETYPASGEGRRSRSQGASGARGSSWLSFPRMLPRWGLFMIPALPRRPARSACAHRPQAWSSWTASPIPTVAWPSGTRRGSSDGRAL